MSVTPSEEEKPNCLLDVHRLNLGIEGNTLLKEISFQLSENEIVAVVGESGSGKSLLALSLLGLQPKNAVVTAQHLFFQKQSLLSLQTQDWQKLRGNKMGMIFQEPQSSLNPSMRLGKQLKEVLEQHTSLSRKKQEDKIR